MKQPIYIRELEGFSRHQIIEKLKSEDILNALLKNQIVKKEKSVFKVRYVGVIIVDNQVINCYPKYIPHEKNIESDFKEIIKVIRRYKKLHDDLEYENEEIDEVSFNLLSMMIFFLEDYYKNGLYNNTKNILEINGDEEIDWDRTINNSYPIIKDNKPYYIEFYTKRKIDDIFDYFRLLHEYILTDCTKRLSEVDLLDLFDLLPVELSDREQTDFGEDEVILMRLEKELNVEFNTRKQKLLKSMHAYISEKKSFLDNDLLTLFGTSTYHVIWEKMCAQIFDNKLNRKLGDLGLDNDKFDPNDTLMTIIKKPIWIYKNRVKHPHSKTFEPDIVTIYKKKNLENSCLEKHFIILDAKYYDLKFDETTLDNKPGLGDVTKQYLYQLSYDDFINCQGFSSVKNALLFPKYEGNLENKGVVRVEILSNLGLEDIKIIMLPASCVNKHYLKNETIQFSKFFEELEKYDNNRLSKLKENYKFINTF